ncbi:MAG TPA: SRPBCC family protein, partial [Candidatus Limnocylindrales bacterium]
RRVTPGAPVVGTPITARRVFGGIQTTLEGEIVRLEPGRAATMELRGGPLGTTRVRYAVEPRSTATSVVTYSAEVDLRRPLRILGPLVPLLGRREARGNLRRLQRRIAAGIPPTSNVADADAQASSPAGSAPPSATPS